MAISSRRWASSTTLVALVVVALAPPPAARADAESPCGQRHPDQVWVAVGESDGVTAFAAELPPGIAARFVEDAFEVAALLRSDLGAVPDMTLCLFGSDVALDGSDLRDMGLLPPGQRLHAAMFAPEAQLFVDTQQFNQVPDAIALGLTHIALWHLAAAAGDSGYPEPLAGAIAQWYAARRNDRLATHRATMRVATFYADPSGTAEASDWLTGSQDPIRVWNPEYQASPIGSFVEDAVAQRGVAMLRQPDPDEWAAADLAWRAALRWELLQGADESRDWVGGMLIASGAVIAAIGLALWGRHQKRRPQVPIGDIAQVEGFFDE